MGVAQLIEKIKAKLPSFGALPVLVPPALSERLSILDKRQLLISCSGVLFFYVIVFSYVYFSSANTIESMEKNMATISVELKEKAPSAYGIGAHKAANPDIGSHEMAKANLLEGLSKYDSMFGRLPVIRAGDQLTSFRAYQTPFSLDGIGNKPVISFVLKDYGLSAKASNTALDILPPEVSFLLSPYADLPQEWINRARAAGHEVWIEIPIQREGSTDSGLNTVFHHDSLSEKGKTMRTSLSRGLGYVGVGVFMDEGITETGEHYTKLLEELYGRGLAALEMNPEAPTFIEAMAVTKAAPYIKTTDNVKRVSGINPFSTVEENAHKTGQAVAVIPPYPVMIKDLALWIEKVGKIDYVIAPASAIYDLPLARAGALTNPVTSPQALGNKDLEHPSEDSPYGL